MASDAHSETCKQTGIPYSISAVLNLHGLLSVAGSNLFSKADTPVVLEKSSRQT